MLDVTEKMPEEWVVEFFQYNSIDTPSWQSSPSFSSWLVSEGRLIMDNGEEIPRTLDECIEFLSLPIEKAQRLSHENGSYRIRNIRTGEIIPGDIFLVE